MRQTVTAAAQVQSQANACNICWEKLDLRQVFLRALRSFPTHSFISPTLYDISKWRCLKTLHLITI
jgi:hypothetical protein